MSLETDRLERRVNKLERELKELSELHVKNDEAHRKLMRNIRINISAGVTAAEFTLAGRLGITMDVVLALMPPGTKDAVQQEIDRRVSELPRTVDVAMKVAKTQMRKEKDDY